METIKVSIEIPREIIEEIDKLMEIMGFERREQFIEVAIKRLIDRYKRLTRYIMVK
ncbi:MAG: hypothetical protein QXX94_06525 [Candidatus Bathyarchaeia archaeon]